MIDTNNRIRQARRQAGLTQISLASRVGVHRSAVAQWERAGGAHPTIENFVRIAATTAVSFEWLTTGRGRMNYSSDILPGDETPAVLLEYSAQSETEARALVALRRLEFASVLAIVEMIETLGQIQTRKTNRQASSTDKRKNGKRATKML